MGWWGGERRIGMMGVPRRAQRVRVVTHRVWLDCWLIDIERFTLVWTSRYYSYCICRTGILSALSFCTPLICLKRLQRVLINPSKLRSSSPPRQLQLKGWVHYSNFTPDGAQINSITSVDWAVIIHSYVFSGEVESNRTLKNPQVGGSEVNKKKLEQR